MTWEDILDDALILASKTPSQRIACVFPTWTHAKLALGKLSQGRDLEKISYSTMQVWLRNASVVELFTTEHPERMKGLDFTSVYLGEMYHAE